MNAGAAPGHSRRTFLIAAAAALWMGIGLLWGLPNHWDPAQDSVAPLGQLARMGADGAQVTQYRYPPFHLLALETLYTPLRWVVNGTAIGRNEKLSATLFILTARLVSAAMTLGACAILLRVGARLWDRRVGLAAALLLLLAPATLYYGKNANLDAPALFWLAAALFFMVRILQEDRLRDYLWLGVTAALAVCTKDQAYAFFVLMPVPLLLHHRKRRRAGGAEPLWRPALYGALGFAVPFVLLHNILFDPQGFLLHVKTIIGPASEGWRECAAGPAGQARLLLTALLRGMDAWTGAGIALAAGGCGISLRGPGDERAALRRALLWPAVSYFVFFPALIGYVYARFMLPLILVFALFAGAAAVRLFDTPDGRGWRRPLAAVLVGWVALGGLLVNLAMSRYGRYDAQHWMEQRFDASTRIYYLGDLRDMPRFNEPLNAYPLSGEDDRSLDALLREKRPDALVLSLERGYPGAGNPALRPAGILRRRLEATAFGRRIAGVRSNAADFERELLAGGLGYVEAARFEGPLAAFVPEVAESLNRTIIILVREDFRWKTDSSSAPNI